MFITRCFTRHEFLGQFQLPGFGRVFAGESLADQGDRTQGVQLRGFSRNLVPLLGSHLGRDLSLILESFVVRIVQVWEGKVRILRRLLPPGLVGILNGTGDPIKKAFQKISEEIKQMNLTSFLRSSLSLSSSLATWTRFLTDTNIPLSTGKIGMSSAARYNRNTIAIVPGNIWSCKWSTYVCSAFCKSSCNSSFLGVRWAWYSDPLCLPGQSDHCDECSSGRN